MASDSDEYEYYTKRRTDRTYVSKAIILIGSLSEFQRDGEISQEQFSSFELFRRNLVNPEIITFDELLERARHITSHDGTTSANIESSDDSPFGETDTDYFDGFAPADDSDDDVPF